MTTLDNQAALRPDAWEQGEQHIIATLEHARFVALCAACRAQQCLGVCTGTAGVGKTASARAYAADTTQGYTLYCCLTPTTTWPTLTQNLRRLALEWQAHRKGIAGSVGRPPPLRRGQGIAPELSDQDGVQRLLLLDEADVVPRSLLTLALRLAADYHLGLICIGGHGLIPLMTLATHAVQTVTLLHTYARLPPAVFQALVRDHLGVFSRWLSPEDFADDTVLDMLAERAGGDFRVLRHMLTLLEYHLLEQRARHPHRQSQELTNLLDSEPMIETMETTSAPDSMNHLHPAVVTATDIAWVCVQLGI